MSLRDGSFLVRSAMLGFLGLAWSVPEPAQCQTRVQVQIQHHERTVTAALNGVPVGPYLAEHTTAIFQATHFLSNGVNRLQVAWRKEGESGLPLSIEVGSIVGGELTSVLTVEPEGDFDGAPSEGGWFNASYEFEVTGLPAFTWHSATTKKRLDDSDRTRIRESAMSLWRAFAQGNANAVIVEIGTPLYEMAGMNEQILTRTEELYREMMADPDWAVKPFPAEGLNIQLHGGMVRVTADAPIIEAGRSPDLSDPDGRRIKLDSLYYAFIDGGWKLVLVGI